ncbi:MAG: hypothetical protein VR65_09385 [Desulfobulbaceae bacterium BRH_c16a]|nr:MAG: hypothetical protein VR65_09385 [Desulfobulbaceae bacterium BRH_c16a]
MQKQAQSSDASPLVLVVESDRNLFDVLTKRTGELGVRAIQAVTLQDGLEKNKAERFDVILMRDILPDGAACSFIQDFQAETQSPEIIIYSTLGDSEQAELAFNSGVWDYVIDSSPETCLPELLIRALRYRQNKSDDTASQQKEIRDQLLHHGIIGGSKELQSCIDLTVQMAQSDGNVLIFGESGTGKELFASAIHLISRRSANKLIIVDCAALPPTLVESILFGHIKGSFTGADKAQPGLIKQSDGGTLFLDEISEMPLEIQKKFLRVIQERTFLPVGGNNETKSDFRLIAATNKDLQAMSDEGTFREDLLFRLKTFQLDLPPLRTRRRDITELAYYFRDTFCKRNKIKRKMFSPDYLMTLGQYDWPGNVRELFQAIERSITIAHNSNILYPKHLSASIRIKVTRKKLQKQQESDEPLAQTNPFRLDLQDMPALKEARHKAIEAQEMRYLETLLNATDGNIKKCCEVSGLSRSRFYDLLKKYRLSATK